MENGFDYTAFLSANLSYGILAYGWVIRVGKTTEVFYYGSRAVPDDGTTTIQRLEQVAVTEIVRTIGPGKSVCIYLTDLRFWGPETFDDELFEEYTRWASKRTVEGRLAPYGDQYINDGFASAEVFLNYARADLEKKRR